MLYLSSALERLSATVGGIYHQEKHGMLLWIEIQYGTKFTQFNQKGKA